VSTAVRVTAANVAEMVADVEAVTDFVRCTAGQLFFDSQYVLLVRLMVS